MANKKTEEKKMKKEKQIQDPFGDLIEKAGGDSIALKTIHYARGGYNYAGKLEAEGNRQGALGELESKLYWIKDDLETCAFMGAMWTMCSDSSNRDIYGRALSSGDLIGEAVNIYETKIKKLSELINKEKPKGERK